MSMPQFPKPDPSLTKEQALTMILSSIAMEEAALSHILNAEGEKIQYVIGRAACATPEDLKAILAVNNSVTNLLEMVMQNQMLLKNKMGQVLAHLPADSSCKPPRPCPPPAPCPCHCPAPCPDNLPLPSGQCAATTPLPCVRQKGEGPPSEQEKNVVFRLQAGAYSFGQPLCWHNAKGKGGFSVRENTGIILPCTGSYVVYFRTDPPELAKNIRLYLSTPGLTSEELLKNKGIIHASSFSRPCVLRAAVCTRAGFTLRGGLLRLVKV